MKKLIFAALAAAALLCGCEQDRTEILKVYNWSDYIGEGVIEEFEQWYEEQTGKPIHVIYQTFDVLETMLSKIEKGQEDYDVVCPSDYMIERMINNDLCLPLDFDFGDTPNYIENNVSPFIKDCFGKMVCGGKDPNKYAVGYMWGTTGILYNEKYVTEEEASTWDVIRNPKFADKIFVKDAARDVCSQIIFHLNQDKLASGEVTYDSLMLDYSEETLARVEEYMTEVRQYVAGWEADFGKEQMVKERAWVNLNWSGDSQWAIEEAQEIGVDLNFVCPKEGFTVFFDGWVIPKYAGNPKAAMYWIDFLCRPEIAGPNAREIGYVPVIGGEQVLETFEDESFPPIDISYFFGPDATAVHMDPVFFPDINTIGRSSIEHDWGDDTHLLVEMWSRVKGAQANMMTIIVIGVAFTCLLGLGIYRKFFRRRRRAGRRSKKTMYLMSKK